MLHCVCVCVRVCVHIANHTNTHTHHTEYIPVATPAGAPSALASTVTLCCILVNNADACVENFGTAVVKGKQVMDERGKWNALSLLHASHVHRAKIKMITIIMASP